MPSSPMKRGQITYESRFGHVCTCTEKHVAAEGNQDGHWTAYDYALERWQDREKGESMRSY